MRFDVTGGLSNGAIQVWSTSLATPGTSDDFVRRRTIRPAHGRPARHVLRAAVPATSTQLACRRHATDHDGGRSVELLGRVNTQQHNAARLPPKVAGAGAWSLFTQEAQGRDRTLASGNAGGIPVAWHRKAVEWVATAARCVRLVARAGGNGHVSAAGITVGRAGE